MDDAQTTPQLAVLTSARCITNNEHETRRGVRQGASYISAAKPQKCYCMGSMNVVLANVALASAGSESSMKIHSNDWEMILNNAHDYGGR